MTKTSYRKFVDPAPSPAEPLVVCVQSARGMRAIICMLMNRSGPREDAYRDRGNQYRIASRSSQLNQRAALGSSE